MITQLATIGKARGLQATRQAWTLVNGQDVGFFISNDQEYLKVGDTVQIKFNPDDQYCQLILPKEVNFQVTLNVQIDPQGTPVDVLKRTIINVINHSLDVGTLTGESEATVENYHFSVIQVPEHPTKQKYKTWKEANDDGWVLMECAFPTTHRYYHNTNTGERKQEKELIENK